MLSRTFAIAILSLMAGNLACSQSPSSNPAIHITVFGDTQQPLAGVAISGTPVDAPPASAPLCKALTDASGKAELTGCGTARQIRVTAAFAGYLPASAVVSQPDPEIVDIALAKSTQVQQTVSVQASSQNPLTESSSSAATLPVDDAKLTPLRPSTLVDALPLVPGVIRTPDGRVQISGMDESHSALLVNSVNVNDPATGNFGLSVPVDSVDSVVVMQSPYLAQYGNFVAGVVSAETRRGGDKWDYSLNDPLPEFRIRSGHLVGLRDATPRLNFSGPLLPNRLYIVEGSEFLLNKAEVRTLPFPENETRSTAFNSFTQADLLLGDRNSLTATLHFAPHSLRYADLNYFDPRPVTPNADYQEDTGTISERFGVAGGLISSTFAGTRVATNVAGQSRNAADAGMLLTPTGNSGNYFGQQTREATRFQWIESWSPATVDRHGQHSFQLGALLAHAEDEGRVMGQNVTINGPAGQLLRTISYQGNGSYSLSDLEMAAYAQDHAVLGAHVAVDAGIRWETQSLTYTNRVAPRAGITWTPDAKHATVLRGGLGVFYDSVPLDTYAFSSYPEQVVTTYDGNGGILDGPRRYLNLTSTDSGSKFPFISRQPRSGNFAPYSVAWNVEAERSISQSFVLRARYLQSNAQNQLTLTPEITPQVSSQIASYVGPALGALVLNSSGVLQGRQLDLTARVGATKQRQFFFSYVRQFARGDQTDASSYLGDFPFPVVRSPITASTAGEIPNRFLAWGTSTLPWRMRITPHVEYRNGFTWQPVDEFQDYLAISAAQPRYPKYFSADARIAKDLNVTPKHAIRLSITIRNLTNHLNPLQVHNNIADPLYASFFGNYGRHYLADFDFLF
jgi:hypothetical protein